MWCNLFLHFYFLLWFSLFLTELLSLFFFSHWRILAKVWWCKGYFCLQCHGLVFPEVQSWSIAIISRIYQTSVLMQIWKWIIHEIIMSGFVFYYLDSNFLFYWVSTTMLFKKNVWLAYRFCYWFLSRMIIETTAANAQPGKQLCKRKEDFLSSHLLSYQSTIVAYQWWHILPNRTK